MMRRVIYENGLQNYILQVGGNMVVKNDLGFYRPDSFLHRKHISVGGYRQAITKHSLD